MFPASYRDCPPSAGQVAGTARRDEPCRGCGSPKQGKQDTQHAPRHRWLIEAHQMLSEVYHWFTEGFDTQDLQEARTLLEELS